MAPHAKTRPATPAPVLTPAQVAAIELLLEIADMAVNLTPSDDYRRDPKAKAAIAAVEKLLRTARSARRRAIGIGSRVVSASHWRGGEGGTVLAITGGIAKVKLDDGTIDTWALSACELVEAQPPACSLAPAR